MLRSITAKTFSHHYSEYSIHCTMMVFVLHQTWQHCLLRSRNTLIITVLMQYPIRLVLSKALLTLLKKKVRSTIVKRKNNIKLGFFRVAKKYPLWKSMVGIFQWKMGGNKRHDYHSCFQKRKRNVSNYISLLCPSVFSFRFHKSFFSFRQERAPLLLLLLHLLRSPTTIRVVVLCAAAACGSAPTRCYYYDGGGGGKLEKASATFVQIINHLARLRLHIWGSKTHRIRQIDISPLQ